MEKSKSSAAITTHRAGELKALVFVVSVTALANIGEAQEPF